MPKIKRAPTGDLAAPDLSAFGVIPNQRLETVESPMPDNMPAELPERAVIVVAVEGEQTSDLRIVDEGALGWREPPLTLTVNHDDDKVAGRLDRFGRVDSIDSIMTADDPVTEAERVMGDTGRFVVATVTFDLAGECGAETARQVEHGFLLGVSMEVGDEAIDYECVEVAEDEDGLEYCEQYLMHLQAATIGAVTVCPFQAIEGARVLGTDTDTPAEVEEVAEVAVAASAARAHEWGPRWWPGPSPYRRHTPRAHLLAAAVDLSGGYPADWFADPGLAEPTPLTITDDGQVFGHIATWGTCHIGRDDICLIPPHSETDYAYFRTGEVVAADGTRVPVGKLTLGTGHASTAPGFAATDVVAHYDNTGTQAAYLAAGEDEHGIWVAGGTRQLSAQVAEELRAAAPSGDWRRIGGNLELVGLLAVNVPGFPVPRPQAAVAASGLQTALVAAVAPRAEHRPCGCAGTAHGNVEGRLAAVEAVVASLGLTDQAIEALAASI